MQRETGRLTFTPGLSDAAPAVQTIKIKGTYSGCTRGMGDGAAIKTGSFTSEFTTVEIETCTSMLNATGLVAAGFETLKWKPGTLVSNLSVEIGLFGAKGVVTSGFSENEGIPVGGSLSGYSAPKFAGKGTTPCGVNSKLKSVKVTFNPVFFA